MRNAIDFRTKIKIIRPDKHALFIFDFDFRKAANDPWQYLSSAQLSSDFKQQISTTLKHGGQYRIVEVKTGRIIKSNQKVSRCQKLPKP